MNIFHYPIILHPPPPPRLARAGDFVLVFPLFPDLRHDCGLRVRPGGPRHTDISLKRLLGCFRVLRQRA